MLRLSSDRVEYRIDGGHGIFEKAEKEIAGTSSDALAFTHMLAHKPRRTAGADCAH